MFFSYIESAKNWIKDHKYPVIALSASCLIYTFKYFLKKNPDGQLIKIRKPETKQDVQEPNTILQIIVESQRKEGLKLFQSSFIQFEYSSTMNLTEEEDSITLESNGKFIIISNECVEKRKLNEVIDDYSKTIEDDLEFKKGKLFNLKGRFAEHGEKNFFITLVWDQAFIIYTNYSLSYVETEIIHNLIFLDRIKEKIIFQGKCGIKIQLPSSSFKLVNDSNNVLLVERNYGEDIEQFKIEQKKFNEKGYIEDQRKEMNGKLYFYGEGGKFYRVFTFSYNGKPYIIQTVSPFVHNFIKDSIESLSFGKFEIDTFLFKNTEEKFSIQVPTSVYYKLKNTWQFSRKDMETLINKEFGDMKELMENEIEDKKMISRNEIKLQDFDAIQLEYQDKDEFILATWIQMKQNIFVISSFTEDEKNILKCKEIHKTFRKE